MRFSFAVPLDGGLTRSESLPFSMSDAAGPALDRGSDTYRRLRELIVSGRLAPGTRVVENNVATRLQVSRTPVRGALLRLEQEGFIVSTPGPRRTRLSVAPLTREDGEEVFWIVGELEAIAANRVASRAREDRAVIVEELRRVNAELRAASEEPEPDARRMFDLHTEFHAGYVRAGSGPRLQTLHASIRSQADRYRRLYSSALGGGIASSLEEHDLIAAAIEAGDSGQAEAGVRSNWRNAAERLAALIDTVGERGTW
jgi:DNA-binding GntR family transcriptional regulator